jgi:hypothetical protein
MLQVGFRQAPITGLSQAEGSHASQKCPFDHRATLRALLPVFTGIPDPGRLDRFKLLRRQMEVAPGVLGIGAEGPSATGSAVLEAEADQGIRLALPIAILPPHG